MQFLALHARMMKDKHQRMKERGFYKVSVAKSITHSDDTSSNASDDNQDSDDAVDIMQIDGNLSLCEIEAVDTEKEKTMEIAVEKENKKPVVENCWKTWGKETVMCWTNGDGPLPSNGDLDFVWRKPKCYAVDIGKVTENKLKVILLMGEGCTWDNFLRKKENWPKGCVKLERVL